MDFYGINITGDMDVDVDNQYDIGEVAKRIKVVYAVTFEGESSAAQWGDLAEKYRCDGACEIGSVMCVSSYADVDLEECSEDLSLAFVGVISSTPGFIMNSKLEDSEIVGLVGRLPVKVKGKINKGDFVVATEGGCARAGKKGEEAFKIGICNQTKDTDDVELVECIIK